MSSLNNFINFDKDNDENEEEENFSTEFNLIEKLGEGMFGTVYKAYSLSLKKLIALKLLNKKKNCTPKKLEVFRNEESIISQMNHPNIINFYMVPIFIFCSINSKINLFYKTKSKETKNFILIALELAEGENLKELFSKNLEFDKSLIREIMTALFSAISHMHSKKIVHRDIKPENLLIKLKDNKLKDLKLIDFGLSFQMQGCYFIKEIMGTPIFYAPEIILKKPYGQVNEKKKLIYII